MKPRRKKIDRRNEDLQRSDIIAISRAKDVSHTAELHRLLEADGTTYSNRRHIVRALGNVGGRQSESALILVLKHGKGLVLGDAAEAVGKLKSRRAIPLLNGLKDHDIPWVRQKVSWALKCMTKKS